MQRHADKVGAGMPGFLLCALLTVACSQGSDGSPAKKPAAVPASATLETRLVGSQRRYTWIDRKPLDARRGITFQRTYQEDGSCTTVALIAQFRGVEMMRFISPGKKSTSSAGNQVLVKSRALARFGRRPEEWFFFGLVGFGPGDGMSCWAPPVAAVLEKIPDSEWVTSPAASAQLCGQSQRHGPDSSGPIIKCSMGCGEFRPLLRTGEYVVKGSSLNVRSGTSVKHPVKFALPRGTKVELIEDVGPLDKHDDEIAPWVKVKTKDGREGFAFGGYLEYTKFWTLTAEEVCNLKGPVGW